MTPCYTTSWDLTRPAGAAGASIAARAGVAMRVAAGRLVGWRCGTENLWRSACFGTHMKRERQKTPPFQTRRPARAAHRHRALAGTSVARCRAAAGPCQEHAPRVRQLAWRKWGLWTAHAAPGRSGYLTSRGRRSDSSGSGRQSGVWRRRRQAFGQSDRSRFELCRRDPVSAPVCTLIRTL